ncbi:hypothetical protein Fmac_005071 [Flemingia macrophylla]|uniref:Uncharacterized protein n=1 Tax=Flemingia macrophylla TaxID=520843 RepID=A0ABD1N7A4_9FABA
MPGYPAFPTPLPQLYTWIKEVKADDSLLLNLDFGCTLLVRSSFETLRIQSRSDSRQNFFAGIDKVRFRKPVIAGDMLAMRMTFIILQKRFGIAKMEGKTYVGGEVACQVQASFGCLHVCVFRLANEYDKDNGRINMTNNLKF